ncbi:specifically androgen-regulated gene protein [Pyxicephalus adspersus]|uniref:Specifically androgen-regulated gene protein n=1 Tax=Pyxicephalus adspersus TaxID=30357 RepID=A0AAV3B7K8_PYXAD|nr:TPA: hypothetical protein GDO54_001566 [Pyxicephalus adspersus]
MPEKKLWARHVGMEALNSVGSTGSCDSIESISSNHSAFSGEGYDHLSAEERECLMFLEETIESLDNEDDSGLSNDELETIQKADTLPVSEPVKIPAGNEKVSSKITAIPKLEEWANTAIGLNPIPQGHHSFPRVQVSKEENTRDLYDCNLSGPEKDQLNLWPEKPKRKSLLNQQQIGESSKSEFLILPPPEAFRDPQIIDKRHSVTDPTDAREVRFDSIVRKSAVILEQNAPAALKQSDQKLPPPVLPRVSSPNKFLTGEQETLNQVTEKPPENQFKQGPPTAPKPRTLPPHIVIKTSRGEVPNLDPQKRPRTFSAHERSTDKPNESVITNVYNSKEQEKARHEALQKLGLEKSYSQDNNSISQSKTDLPAAIEVKRRSIIIKQQEEAESSRNIPKLVVPQKVVTNVKNEVLTRNRLSMKSTVAEKSDEPSSGNFFSNQKEAFIKSDGPTTSDITVKTKHTEKTSIQEKAKEMTTPSLADVHVVTDDSKNIRSEIPRNSLQLNPVPQRKEKNVTDEPDLPLNQDISRNPVKLQTSTAPIQTITVPEKNPLPGKKIEHIQSSIAKENKSASLENINIFSTSPRNRYSFSPPKEPLVTQHSPKFIRKDGNERPPIDKSNRHSTHFEPSDESCLRLPQGSVPGLRQINIKSNTLERSGVGLSSSLPSIEKGGNSFFKKPLFSGNFLRNTRPRPASLGTGKDFANLESGTAGAERTEKQSFFSKPSRQSAPVTSVKIAPKGSTDEHRRQALKKLGILKE